VGKCCPVGRSFDVVLLRSIIDASLFCCWDEKMDDLNARIAEGS
jgi:hypothetical protein